MGPAAVCGWGWWRGEVSWSVGCAVCPRWGKEIAVVCTVVPAGYNCGSGNEVDVLPSIVRLLVSG